MKRILVVGLIFIVGAMSAFSIDLSAGAVASYKLEHSSISATGFDAAQSVNLIGVSAFVDAQYVVAEVGVNYFLGGKLSGDLSGDIEGNYIDLAISVLGKYPIELGSVILAPAGGIEYDMNLIAEDVDGNDLKEGASSEEKADFNRLWFRVGALLDIPTSEAMYVRVKALAGFRGLNNGEQDMEDMGADIFNSGLELGVGVGFKF